MKWTYLVNKASIDDGGHDRLVLVGLDAALLAVLTALGRGLGVTVMSARNMLGMIVVARRRRGSR